MQVGMYPSLLLFIAEYFTLHRCTSSSVLSTYMRMGFCFALGYCEYCLYEQSCASAYTEIKQINEMLMLVYMKFKF